VHDRSDLLPYVKEDRGSKEDDVLDWIAIGEGGCFIRDRFLAGEHPSNVMRGELENYVGRAWQGLEFFTGEGTIPDMRSMVMFDGNFEAAKRVYFAKTVCPVLDGGTNCSCSAKAESCDWLGRGVCDVCRGDRMAEEGDLWCSYLVDGGFVGFGEKCMFMGAGVNLDGDLMLRSRPSAREAALAEALVCLERTLAFVPPSRGSTP
jgi:hypothetical protein